MLTIQTRFLRLLVMMCLVVLLGSLVPITALAQVQPPLVEAELYPGESLVVEKAVTTPVIPLLVDICLLEDETGSFGDDIFNLQIAAPALYDTIVATSPTAEFAVAGFRDYPINPYGLPGDWVYRLLSSMSPNRAAWLNGVNALTAPSGAGNDEPEAQYDAIVAATGPGTFNDPTLGEQNNCGWRADPRVQRVLVVATDAPFHNPDGAHVNDLTTTLAALQAQGIILVGLKASGAGGEIDALAAATGGSVQPLSSDGANIAQAILAALEQIMTDVWWEATCDTGLVVNLTPDVHYDIPGGTTVVFQETVSVPGTTLPGDYSCTVTFYANEYPAAGAVIGEQTVNIHVASRLIPVPLDIKPTSCPNPLNVTSKGVLPVAILGTVDLDVTTIDPATILLEGVAPLRWSYEDVATPYVPFLGKPLDPYACNQYGPDGYRDLVLHFDTQAVVMAISPVNDGDVLMPMLTGNLNDGRVIAGEDVVKIIKKK